MTVALTRFMVGTYYDQAVTPLVACWEESGIRRKVLTKSPTASEGCKF